jgi:dTDP-4-dehydrorhamnose 3,5-epimerase
MNDRFDMATTSLEGLSVLTRKPLGDVRGFLERIFCESELAGIMGGRRIVQMNRTLTRKTGTIRGIHFQRAPHMELKLVSCLRGEVFDVAVDMRPDSPTYLCWHGEILSDENHKTLAIPEGFAHGFQTLEENCEMLYFHTAAHHPESEGGLHPLDPALAVSWPLPVAEISTRDSAHPFLTDDNTYDPR